MGTYMGIYSRDNEIKKCRLVLFRKTLMKIYGPDQRDVRIEKGRKSTCTLTKNHAAETLI